MTAIQKAREALTDLLETMKIHKASVLNGMTKREIQFLMDAMHKGNAALAALDAETEVKTAASVTEAANIGDAVLAWMVKFDLLDADNEYYAADVLAVLDALVPPESRS